MVDIMEFMMDLKMKLLEKIDCTKEYPSEKYFSEGNVKVVSCSMGQYREAEARPLSRFGYRFQIKNIDKPHMAVVRYPDDKPRFMIVNDGTSYDLSTGIQTGQAYPISGKIQEIQQIFWARWTDCSIVFMSWGYNEPAAVESIEIYELDELPPLRESQPIVKNHRVMGIQYEDPCGTTGSEGALTFEQWLDHVVTYAKYSGQKHLAYPICWYHGPLFPSKREPSDCFGIIVAQDRKQYCPWTTEPADWPAVLLDRFEKEGLEFQGVLTLLRLGSLMKKMNIDLESIKSGNDTINSMLWSNNVQAGTSDWTYTYNALNYDKLVEYDEAGKSKSDFPWAYGEKIGQPYHAGPILNPLHPQVQEAVIGFITETAERYSKYSAFKGVAISMWPATIAWFGSLHSGYDDYTMSLLEKETGIKVPVEPNAPDRFSKRFEYLTFNCREAWINWRCLKIHDFISRIRDAVRGVRADMELTLNLWSETVIPAILSAGGPEHQIGARKSTVDLYLEAGLDLELFKAEPNIRFDLQLEGGGRDRSRTNSPDVKLEDLCMFRDHDFLDLKSLDAVGGQEKPGSFIFNAWHEAWGTHKWFKCGKDDEGDRYNHVYGKKSEGVFRINSEYPVDGFWWNSQLRISPAFAPGEHFMEQYAHSVAEFDACRITRGGLFMDKAHGEMLRSFSKAYCALPAEKFETVGQQTDPIAVRQCLSHGKKYFYLVNREYYPVDVKLHFNKKPKSLLDLANGEAVAVESICQFKLTSYELKSFSVDNDIQITQVEIFPPDEIVKPLLAEAEKALKQMKTVRESGKIVLGMEQFDKGIRDAMKNRRFAWLRRSLSCYVVRKCSELSKI